MTTKRTTPALYRALESLDETIGKHISGRIPPIAALAKKAGVSGVTMFKAVRLLISQGRLAARPKAGIHIMPSTTQQSRSSRSSSEPQRPIAPCGDRVLAGIRTAILEGRYSEKRFPSLKELCAEYGAGQHAVQQALTGLAQHQIIVRHGRGYRLDEGPLRQLSASVTLVSAFNNLPAIAAHTERAAECCAILEKQCIARSVGLNLVQADHLLQQRSATHAQWPEYTLGFLVFAQSIQPDTLVRLVHLLAATGKPVAVFDISGDYPEFKLPTGDRVRMFEAAGAREAGRRVGALLHTMGHRRIGYFSPYNRFLWSSERLDGLRETYAPPALTEFTLERIQTYSEITSILQQEFMPGAKLHLDSFMESVNTYFCNGDDTLLANRIYPHLIDQYVESLMRPLFARALEDRSITAWVGTNDMVALLGMKFLTQHKIAVPGNISIIGFDDIFPAGLHGLSTYNFNVSSILNAAIDHVIAPQRTRHIAPRTRTAVTGILITRQSLRRRHSRDNGVPSTAGENPSN